MSLPIISVVEELTDCWQWTPRHNRSLHVTEAIPVPGFRAGMKFALPNRGRGLVFFLLRHHPSTTSARAELSVRFSTLEPECTPGPENRSVAVHICHVGKISGEF